MALKILGSKELPCHGQGFRLDETTEPQIRICKTCRRHYNVTLRPAEEMSKKCEPFAVYRLEIIEAPGRTE